MSVKILYRILEDGVTRDLFAEIATEIGLSRHGVVEDGDDGYEEAWTNTDGTNLVNYVEDPYSQLNYLSVRGPNSQAMVEALDDQIALYDPEELIEVAESPEGRPVAVVEANLLGLGITFTEHDPRVHSIFETYATKAPYPELRTTALDAIGLRAWEELRPVVEQVARDDPDPEVRKHAEAVLVRWDAARQK